MKEELCKHTRSLGGLCHECERERSPAKAVKFDTEKKRLELLPFLALEQVGDVFTYGAKKYGAFNYRKGMSWSRLIGAALRHLFAFARGENKDPESGLLHLAHCACCILMLIDAVLLELGEDDRWKKS